MPLVVADNEIDRLTALSEYNLDFSSLKNSFNDLTTLAAACTGTAISMVNLIDAYTEWTIGNHGLAKFDCPREETVCQYVASGNMILEVPDLSADIRFRELGGIKGEGGLRYYYGVPITTEDGYSLGSLCIIDYEEKVISQDKKDLLKLLAREVITRLNTLKKFESLQKQVQELSDSKRMLAHDVRGPLGGIIGLAELACEELPKNTDPEVIDYLQMIRDSGRSTISMIEDILNAELGRKQQLTGSFYNLSVLKDKVFDLFTPRILSKKLSFTIDILDTAASYLFPKKNVLQVIGNLISNAIKFTPEGGRIVVNLSLSLVENHREKLMIKVSDSGVGMTALQITQVLSPELFSLEGTAGETGYGLGLGLVKKILDETGGEMQIDSEPGKGTVFNVAMPL